LVWFSQRSGPPWPGGDTSGEFPMLIPLGKCHSLAQTCLAFPPQTIAVDCMQTSLPSFALRRARLKSGHPRSARNRHRMSVHVVAVPAELDDAQYGNSQAFNQ